MLKLLHSRRRVVLWVKWIVLQWTLGGRCCTASGQCSSDLNCVCYTEHYVEGTAQQAEGGIVRSMECVTVNSKWKILHSKWTVFLWRELCVLQWTRCECTAQQVDIFIVSWMECVSVNCMWKVLHSRRSVVLRFERSVLQWTLCGRYCTAGRQYYCGLNGLCYSEKYVECPAQQVDSVIVAWM